MNIAIFGGSFDPPHNGHKAVIEQVLDRLQIDLLIILVAYQNPLKSHYRIHSHKRFLWMQTLCKDYERVLCSDYELQRNRVTTTMESVRYFQNLYKIETLYFVLGMDNFLQVPQWSDFDLLRLELSFVVIERDILDVFNNGQSVCEDFAKQNKLKMQYLQFSYPYSSSIIVKDIEHYRHEIPESIRHDVIESYAKIKLIKRI